MTSRVAFATVVALGVVAHTGALGAQDQRRDSENIYQRTHGMDGADAPSPPPRDQRAAIWVQPFLPVFGAVAEAVGSYPGRGFVQGNLGFNLSLTRGLDYFATFGVSVPTNPFGSGFGMVLSTGVAILLTGDRRLNGLFVAPKLEGGVSIVSGGGGGAFYFGPGVDVGYQVTVGAFFFAPVFGLTLGTAFAGQVAYTPVFNLNLFRIGVAF